MANIIDAPRSQLDTTVRVFDNFYKFDLVIDGNQYEIVNSYFYSTCNSVDVAKNFTTMLFRIANITGESPMVLLDYLKGTSKVETTAIMAYYLNSIKSKTTLYGISNTPIPNQTVQRNILT
jgi:hypothetical protein